MEIGDRIRLKSDIIRYWEREYLRNTETAPRIEQIRKFLHGEHTIIGFDNELGANLVIKCPVELGIGRVPGTWRPGRIHAYVVNNKVGPCKCDWVHCQSKPTQDLVNEK
jgi:hypothetical protein